MILLLGDMPWLALKNVVFFCEGKFYISNLGSTGMAESREVRCGMKLLLYWTHWKNLDLKSCLSAHDRYALLVKKYKTKWNEEEKSSGTKSDCTELDGALMDLIQRFNEAYSERKRETNDKKLKIKKELAKAQEMRQASLEIFCQTKKRK